MRILIVDDQSNKLTRITHVIKQIPGIEENDCEYVLDLLNAKKRMTEICYDLLIMDLNIYENLEDSIETEGISESTGLLFIDEIIETDIIRTPAQILILTEYDELKEKYLKIGKNYEFQILKFDSQSQEWEKEIENKIKYHLEYEKSLGYFSKNVKCDVAVICAVPNEFNAVKRAFDDYGVKRINFDNDNVDYYVGRKGNIQIVYAQQRDMGMSAAATLSLGVIQHFEPKYLIMVGIAGGIGSEKNPGDILVATEVWDYSSGKYAENESGETVFKPDPKHLILDEDVEAILRRDYSDILFGIKKGWQEPINHDLQLILGTLACGTAVVGSIKIVKEEIIGHARKAIGLDMESYGVFYSAKHGFNKKVIPICLKSISDFADVHKNDNAQHYAAYTSVSFAKYMIENLLPM